MERLDLSYNSISKLYSLSTLTNLLTLDLSGNNLSSLDGLQSMDKLERLDLSGNYIGKMSIVESKEMCFFSTENLSFRKYKRNLVKKWKKLIMNIYGFCVHRQLFQCARILYL